MSDIARNAAVEVGFFAALWSKVANTLSVWSKRIDTRRELAELTFRDIQDIGLDQAEIEREIAKPFWRE